MAKTWRKSKLGKKYQDKDRKIQKASRSCLHHGGCPYCEGNRLHKNKNRAQLAKLEIMEFNGRDL